jgi:3-dehydroquinate synthase
MYHLRTLAEISRLIYNYSACIIDQKVSELYPFLSTHQHTFILQASENNKSRALKATIEDWLFSHKLKRNAHILIIGGGITTDLGGFVCANYMRGISWSAIPSTLLGMVDATIGGKVAINTPFGKNTLGTFHPANELFICCELLASLTHQEKKSGMVEMIKHLLLDCPGKLSSLNHDTLLSQDSILESIQIKERFVKQDPYDKGPRNLLNIGHTVAHAIELQSDFKISHGEAVAWGLVIEGYILKSAGKINPQDYINLKIILLRLFTTPPAHLSFDQLQPYLALDKKNQSDIVISCPGSDNFLYTPSLTEWTNAFKSLCQSYIPQ